MILPPENRLTGLVTATFTPLHPDGSLNLDRIPALVEQLAADGVAGLYVLGSTGEGASLSSLERMAVAEAFVQAAKGRLTTVIQVGHNSIAEARNLAEHAQMIGADAISAMPPSYFKANNGALIGALAEICRGAPALPCYYYHIPAMTGVELDMAEFLAEASERLPTLAGIKFSDCRLNEMDFCLRFGDGMYDVVFGIDEMLLSALVVGARGAVGSTYGFAAPLYLRIIRCFEEGDLVRGRDYQSRAAEMVRVILRHCGRAGLKAAMALIGHDCGPYRLPQDTASREDVVRMANALEAIGFFDWGRNREATRPAAQPLDATAEAARSGA
ncbi:MAG: dihydrodipicolinate synthase family protein [Longimicrobiales bacterium]